MNMNDNARAVATLVIACTMTVVFWRWTGGSLWSFTWLAIAAPSHFT